jgi:hypothetical protein
MRDIKAIRCTFYEAPTDGALYAAAPAVPGGGKNEAGEAAARGGGGMK